MVYGENSKIPPTAVGGLFKSNLQIVVTEFLNPTNGKLVGFLNFKAHLFVGWI